MASLDARLNAYRSKSKGSKARHNSAIEIIQKTYSAHPLTKTPIDLGAYVRLNFRDETIRENLLFFDLESTGLGSSEQVYPFLIGICSQATGPTLTQFYATTPADEPEVLAEFIRFAQGKTLVSFNGKSFDLPLIMRRAEKYNLTHDLRHAKHIDLYHLIRRIYPEKPARLIDAETRLLGFARQNDIGGAEVAQAYFESLRFGEKGFKEKILSHNAWDVLTLLALMRRVSDAFTQAREGNADWAYKIHRDKSAEKAEQKQLLTQTTNRDARDEFALGQIYRTEKRYRRAVRHFCLSYRTGYAPAIVDAVRALRRLKKPALAGKLAGWAMRREDERVQRRLIAYL